MKNIIHKIKWSIISLILPFGASAQGGGTGGQLTNPLNSQTIAQLVENIARLAAQIGIPVAAIFIIYSGILFITARGSEEQLKKAKTNFMWAMIGTAILMGAWERALPENVIVMSKIRMRKTGNRFIDHMPSNPPPLAL